MKPTLDPDEKLEAGAGMTGRVAFWVIYGSLFIACGSDLSENCSSSSSVAETDAVNNCSSNKVGNLEEDLSDSKNIDSEIERGPSTLNRSNTQTQANSSDRVRNETASKSSSETAQASRTTNSFNEAQAVSTLEEAGVAGDSLDAAVVEARAFNLASKGGKSGDQEVANLVGILNGAGVDDPLALIEDLLGIDLADLDIEALIGDLIAKLPAGIL